MQGLTICEVQLIAAARRPSMCMARPGQNEQRERDRVQVKVKAAFISRNLQFLGVRAMEQLD